MSRHSKQLVPQWDARAWRLSFGSVMLKQFRRSAPAQHRLLGAFQEENWAPLIDDPLPPVMGILPAQRLRDVIKNLNRTLCVKLIRFGTDGTGTRVVWRDLSSSSANPPEQCPSSDRSVPSRNAGRAPKRRSRKAPGRP